MLGSGLRTFPTPEEADHEVMFAVGDVATLRSPTANTQKAVSPVKTRCAQQERSLSPY